MLCSGTADTATVADDLRGVLRRVPATVVVVTSFVAGRPWGVTASSFSSVCLDPPTVSVALFSHTALVQAVRLHGRLGISVLAASQVDVARAAALPGAPKFLEPYAPESDGLGEAGAPYPTAGRRWDPTDGCGVPAAPSVHGALAHLDCSLVRTVAVGDHDLLLARVESVREAGAELHPLLYARRSFFRLPDDPIES